MIFRLRALAFAVLFPLGTLAYVLAALTASLVSRRALHRTVLGWADMHAWLARHILGVHSQVEGNLPDGAYLLAFKHQSMFETVETLRLFDGPVVVLKRELADIPLFGKVTRLFGVIPVERQAGAKALRAMVAAGKEARQSGRRVAIFPEGTRVPWGERPPLRPGFAGLYRALGLPVVPIAVDSGRLWGRSLARRSGTVTFQVGEPIPPGLGRDEIEARVHEAINALNSGPQARL